MEQEGYLQSSAKNNSSSLSISYIKSNNHIIGFPHHSPSHYPFIPDTHRVSTLYSPTLLMFQSIYVSEANIFVSASTGTVPNDSASELSEHPPTWNRCYPGESSSQVYLLEFIYLLYLIYFTY